MHREHEYVTFINYENLKKNYQYTSIYNLHFLLSQGGTAWGENGNFEVDRKVFDEMCWGIQAWGDNHLS